MKKLPMIVMAVAVLVLQIPLSIYATEIKGDPRCSDDGSPYAQMSASAYGGTQELTVDFDSQESHACFGEISSVTWDFGDGQTANGATATNTYGVGEWTAAVTITNTNDLSTTNYRVITVRETNEVPIAMDDEMEMSIRYNDQYPVYQAYSNQIANNDADADGDQLNYRLLSETNNATAELTSWGNLKYTPNDGFFGVDALEYEVSDGFGGLDTATIYVDVQWANFGQTIAHSDYSSTNEDTAVTVDVLNNDFDGDGDQLSVSVDSYNANDGVVTLNADNTITFLPTQESYDSQVIINYTASDPYGAFDSSFVSIYVNPVNDAPVANDDSLELDEDTSASIQVLNNDTDVDSANLQAVVETQPANGTLSYDGNGVYIYSPDANFNGADVFTYTVNDGDGGTSNLATVSITVSSVYDPLLVNGESVSLNEDTNLYGNVLANDIWETSSAFALVASAPANGSVNLNQNGDYTYTPNANFYGSDSFSYTVNDGVQSASATVQVTVLSVNDGPIADFTYTIGRRNIVSFDASSSSDLEGPLTYSWTFSDGTTDTGVSVSKTLKKKTTYTVALTVTDQDGYTATKTLEIKL